MLLPRDTIRSLALVLLVPSSALSAPQVRSRPGSAKRREAPSTSPEASHRSQTLGPVRPQEEVDTTESIRAILEGQVRKERAR